MKGSRVVLKEFSSGLCGLLKVKGISDFAANKLCVLDNIVVASNALSKDILHVENTGSAAKVHSN